ncbi:MAG: hypothetical protein CME26_14255 [Gemmatimonadetes bacterium]|nr:hypothetical protein [Gemmatimonadota bacterium]
MKVLVTGSDRPFGRSVATRLREVHDVVGVGRGASEGIEPVDLSEPDQVAPLVSGVEALVHADAFEIEGLSEVSHERTLDEAARGAYVLLDEAQKAGVARAVCISTLELLRDYPDGYVIDETFRPRPEADALSLAPYLVEQTFREFARQGPLVSICLRFGAIDRPDGTPGDLAGRAIDRALVAPLDGTRSRWFLYHVSGSDRFPIRGAKQSPFSFETEG